MRARGEAHEGARGRHPAGDGPSHGPPATPRGRHGGARPRRRRAELVGRRHRGGRRAHRRRVGRRPRRPALAPGRQEGRHPTEDPRRRVGAGRHGAGDRPRALPRPLVVGGRSAGARVACRTAEEVGADAVLCLSFPLHPPGKPESSRAEELLTPIRAGLPVHVVQGERDPFGTPDEVRAVRAPDAAYVSSAKGTHSFGKGAGRRRGGGTRVRRRATTLIAHPDQCRSAGLPPWCWAARAACVEAVGCVCRAAVARALRRPRPGPTRRPRRRRSSRGRGGPRSGTSRCPPARRWRGACSWRRPPRPAP